MKQLTYITLFLLGILLALTACSREEYNQGGGQTTDDNRPEGQINLASLKLTVQTGADTSVSTRTDEDDTTVDTRDYMIRIYDTDNGNKLVKEWKYSEMPEIFSLKVGNYEAAAFSHEVLPAEFEHPLYYGKQAFTITENTVTEVATLKCILSSIMVTVEYDDALKALLGSDVKAQVTVGEGTLDFAYTDTRAGYFEASSEADNVLTANLTGTIEGTQVEMSKGFNNIKKGEHRIIRYTLKSIDEGGNTEGGSAGITINIDVTCEVVDKDIVVDPDEPVIPDEPTEPEEPEEPGDENAPTIVGKDFDIKEAINIPVETSTTNPYPVVVNFSAPKGIAHVNVTISSTNESFEGVIKDESVLGTTSFDLANPANANLAEKLTNLGFPVGDAVIGQTAMEFVLTPFTPLLGIYGVGEHSFKIELEDAEGNVTTETLVMITQSKQ